MVTVAVAVWTSVVAVLGTLSGALVVGGVQARAARVARREARFDDRRAAVLAAVTSLVAALADHRRAAWVLQDLRLAGAYPAQVVEDARAATHVTRAAVTEPLTTLTILAPSLAEPARRAADAAYALRDAASVEGLTGLREVALAASDQLVCEAQKNLG